MCRMRRTGATSNGGMWLAAAMTVQLVTGIVTLLYQVPILMALAHQGMALLVLTIASIYAARLFVRARSGESLPRT